MVRFFRDLFFKHVPSRLEITSLVKAYTVAETLLWSAWNFITPIFGIYVTSLVGGTVDVAATAYSIYLVSRVIFELVSGRYLVKKAIAYKFLLTILGMAIISLSYVGLAYSQLIIQIYIFYGMIGLGIGLATPAKNALFSSHLTPDNDTSQWSNLDASVFLSMALAAVVGGFIARVYGFETLFLVAAVVNLVGIIPYLIYIKHWKKIKDETVLS